MFVMALQYGILGAILYIIPSQYQPIVAVSLPLLKKINTLWTNNVRVKCSSGDPTGCKLVNTYAVGSQHSMQINFFIGTIATTATSSLLMSINFLTNIILCLRIVWMKKRHLGDNQKLLFLLQRLALNEINEFMTPLICMASLFIAYYGNNSTLIGNVGSSDFQFREIEDIGQTIKNMLVMFLVDFSSLIISGFILLIVCNINLMNAIGALEIEFGTTFLTILSMNVTAVSN